MIEFDSEAENKKNNKKMSFDLLGEDDEDDSLFHHKPTKQTAGNNDDDEGKLPDLSFLSTKSDDTDQNKKQQKLNENQSTESNTDVSQNSNTPQEIIADESKPIENPKTKSPKKSPKITSKTKPTGKKVHTKYDVENSLNLFKQNLEEQFNQLELQISSLKPERPQYKHVALSNSKIAQQIKSIVMDSAQKDREITDLESKINEFSSAFSEREEREKLRKQIQELTSEMEKEKSKETDNTNLLTFVQNLEKQLERIDIEHKKAEELEKSISKTKIEQFHQKYDTEKQQMENKIKQFENDKNQLTETLNQLTKSNEELEKQPIPDFSKEIAEIKQKQNDGIRKVVQMIAMRTLQTIQSTINPNKSYSKDICIQGIKAALQEQAEFILNPDDYEEEYEYD